MLLMRGDEGDGAACEVQSEPQEVQGGFCFQEDVSSIEVFVAQYVGCRSREPPGGCDHESVVHVAEQESIINGAKSRCDVSVGPTLFGDRDHHQTESWGRGGSHRCPACLPE